MKTIDFLIKKDLSLRDALLKIESTHKGIVFLIDDQDRLCGALTDGDVRRYLMRDGSLDDSVYLCANKNYISLYEGDKRELLLKHLDSRAKYIPIVSSDNRVVSIVSRENLPLIPEGRVIFRSRAPVRISFGGGGSDLTNFFYDNSGAVINATINLYTHVLLTLRDDQEVHIVSEDFLETIVAKNLEEALKVDTKLTLIQSILKIVHPQFGFNLTIYSDFPIGSGLGGSATVASAVLGVFNQLRTDKWNKYELSELAFQAERFNLGVSGGWQDQYASVFGGFNFIEFSKEKNLVIPLKIEGDLLLDLQENLVLCDTGINHVSGDIHDEQRNDVLVEEINNKVQENVELTYLMRQMLLRGELSKFGGALDAAWVLKRQFSKKITTPKIDAIYSMAKESGALGGKLLGAGGGGFFLFYVEPENRSKLVNSLNQSGVRVRNFNFEFEGLIGWTSRT